MPTLSTFYGIVIRLYWDDHEPPHFHAIYGEHAAAFAIDDCRLLSGRFPARASRLVREWWELHHAEITQAWDSAYDHRIPDNIEPLP